MAAMNDPIEEKNDGAAADEVAMEAVTFRLPSDLRARLEAQARAEERSLSAFLRFHLPQVLASTTTEGRAA